MGVVVVAQSLRYECNVCATRAARGPPTTGGGGADGGRTLARARPLSFRYAPQVSGTNRPRRPGATRPWPAAAADDDGGGGDIAPPAPGRVRFQLYISIPFRFRIYFLRRCLVRGRAQLADDWSKRITTSYTISVARILFYFSTPSATPLPLTPTKYIQHSKLSLKLKICSGSVGGQKF